MKKEEKDTQKEGSVGRRRIREIEEGGREGIE